VTYPIHLRPCAHCPHCGRTFADYNLAVCPNCSLAEVPGGDPVPVRLWRISAPGRYGRQWTPPNFFGPERRRS
jgi:hypothetical protein